MKNTRIILSGILSLVLCLSLIVGGTFALFTHESKTNIAITSGKVEVLATIENLTLYSPALIAADGSYDATVNAAHDGMFVNGGTAVLEDGVKLTLTNATPGDKVNFQIKLTNNSNVAIKYRTVIRVLDDNGLSSGLKMVIGEEYNGSTKYTNWADMTVAENTKVLDCSVELPTTAGNTYQNKSCTIVFTVEAVQGNAETDNNVAKIGDTAFVDLQSAINAAQEGETVEIIRPGTYAPFTVSKKNVTVKGIIGEDKARSTVIKTTATENIKLHADNVTIDSLYVDGTTTLTLVHNNAGLINGNNHPDSNTNSAKITVNNCTIVGEGTNNAVCYVGPELVFTNNRVENVDRLNMLDNHSLSAATHTYTGNTVGNVGYEMLIVNAYNGVNFTFEGNKVNDATMISFNDLNDAGTGFAALTVSGNTAIETVYRLGWFNTGVATPNSIATAANERIVTFNAIHFNANGNDLSLYQIQKTDGAFTPDLGHTGNIAALGTSVLLEAGSYEIVEKATGNPITVFTVDAPVAGVTQTVELPSVVSVGTKADLIEALTNASVAGAGNSAINITSDMDLTGETWTPFNIDGYNGADIVTINGNGHTITGLSAPLFAGGFAGGSGIVINELTIADSTMTSSNGVGAGAFIEDADSMDVITLNDCHLINVTLTSTDSECRTGALIGYATGYAGSDGPVFATITVTDCSVVDCVITGEGSVGGIIGHAGANVNTETIISDCTIQNTTLTSNKTGSYRVGEVIGTANGGNVTMSNITATGNTVSQPNANSGKDDAHAYVGRFALNETGVVKLDGNEIG